jgi:hypothetical protein
MVMTLNRKLILATITTLTLFSLMTLKSAAQYDAAEFGRRQSEQIGKAMQDGYEQAQRWNREAAAKKKKQQQVIVKVIFVGVIVFGVFIWWVVMTGKKMARKNAEAMRKERLHQERRENHLRTVAERKRMEGPHLAFTVSNSELYYMNSFAHDVGKARYRGVLTVKNNTEFDFHQFLATLNVTNQGRIICSPCESVTHLPPACEHSWQVDHGVDLPEYDGISVEWMAVRIVDQAGMPREAYEVSSDVESVSPTDEMSDVADPEQAIESLPDFAFISESTTIPTAQKVDGWCYKLMGEELGPVSTEELQELIANGSLDPFTHICHNGQEEWKSAMDYPEFTLTSAETPNRNPSAPDSLAGNRVDVTPVDPLMPPGSPPDQT